MKDKKAVEKKEEKYYHVLTADGIKLYAKSKVKFCRCDGSLHRAGLGCS